MTKIDKMPVLSDQEVALLRADFGLSHREAEIVRLMFQGMSDKEIAWQMHISFGTERAHISHLFRKCGACCRRQLIGLVFWRLHTHKVLAEDDANCNQRVFGEGYMAGVEEVLS